MGGLTQFERHEVGRVDDVVAWAQAQSGQAALQPHRAGADAHTVDAPQREAGRTALVLDLDGKAVVVARVALVEADSRVLYPPAKLGADVTRDAEQAERVAAVGRELELDHRLLRPHGRQG